ncbi:DNA sulfur modification protein DndD [Methylobacterium sp. 174MFSha1.1]|uniref:AAA family ATPase n=1 Tax=Methylobacterium sp. 174MFSha1.1 TaxID=1502749 RepID=UPI0008E03E77|nr:AAA family ATPase [Methylobacterium sp. 174MFSha1.1]SFU78165.1 DNA sulfur modification protein DndD [Methylobacterium sp. 174MFSha1.1]
MKLLCATFKNFRLLRDLELKFATDPEKRLTVIRAANETGKTTILTALQWALYGDAALPGGGADFRLHPIDWDPETEGARVPISVDVEFEVVRLNKGHEIRRQYRLLRTVDEEIAGARWSRSSGAMKVWESTSQGTRQVQSPEALITDELPTELREVFFTDGDRALSFIEAEVSIQTKRQRVQSAIRSLLGLDVLENAAKHIKRTEAEVNKQARSIGGGSDIQRVSVQLEKLDTDIESIEKERDDANEQFTNWDTDLAKRERQLSEALQKGDKEKLQREFEAAKASLKRVDGLIAAASKEHATLFTGRPLARDLLSTTLGPVFEKLDSLKDKNEIPNTTVPVLEERLSSGMCICGECLDPARQEASDDPDGAQRRGNHIRSLIEKSRAADDVKQIVTDLYFHSRDLRPAQPAQGGVTVGWIMDYARIVEQRHHYSDMRQEAGRKLKALEAQIDQLEDTHIREIQDAKKFAKEQRDKHLNLKTRAETRLEGLRENQTRLKAERTRLVGEQSKGVRVLAELNVVQDISSVLKRAYDRITTDELRKVSAEMNSIFLEMIGADPEQGAIIQQAEISAEFDIIVYGPDRRTLNPDRDLNGASRRALTLAFILALTKVSEVEAPNVIDTPLGMMSGYVKRSVLRKAIQESAQLVLFLTHSEIEGCEEIIDKTAGTVVTLTNPAHFPRMLVNDSRAAKRTVLKCGCNHRQECNVCRRRLDAEELEMVS